MKKLLLGLAVLALVSAPAFAGPNAGGTLIVHDTGIAWSSDPVNLESPPPAECLLTDNNVAFDVLPNTLGWVWKVYAAFPPDASPRLKALAFGENFTTPGVVVFTGNLPTPATDFEVPNNGWPTTSGGEAGLSFGTTKTDVISYCYWFAGYGYLANATFAVVGHSNPENRFFIDDSVPPVSDPIMAYSSIGFGAAGQTNCPNVVVPGACCFTNGDCQFLPPDVCASQGGTFVGGPCEPTTCPQPVTGACCINEVCFIRTQAACVAEGGTFIGPNVPCVPNPCLIPVEETTWGQIKANYR